MNVEASLLGTRGELGYALTGVGIDYSDEVVEQLRAMSPTVRLRVLSSGTILTAALSLCSRPRS